MVEVGSQSWAVCLLSVCLLPLPPGPSQLNRILPKPDVDSGNSTDAGDDLERIPASGYFSRSTGRTHCRLAGCVSAMGEARPHVWGSPPPDLPLINPLAFVSHFVYSGPRFLTYKMRGLVSRSVGAV